MLFAYWILTPVSFLAVQIYFIKPRSDECSRIGECFFYFPPQLFEVKENVHDLIAPVGKKVADLSPGSNGTVNAD